jgi:hypothetical protein
MRLVHAMLIAAIVLCCSGCMSDRTKNMATTCQDLLASNEQASVSRFIREADEQLATLNEPQNKLTMAVRDMQDRESGTYMPVLEQCVAQLKSSRL